MRIHGFITYFVKLLLSTRCRGAGLLYMAAEDVWKLEHTQRELDGRFQHHPTASEGDDRLDRFPKLGSL